MQQTFFSALASKSGLVRYAFAILLLAGCSSVAHAQGNCNDLNINRAFAAKGMALRGSGVSGDCDPSRYKGGNYGLTSELQILVQHSRDCTDPWIGEIFALDFGRVPSASQCNRSTFGASASAGYPQLEASIKAYMSGASSGPAMPSIAAGDFIVTANLSLADSRGVVVAQPGGFLVLPPLLTKQQVDALVAQGGGNLSAAQINMLVAQGGGNLTDAQRRTLVAQGGGNMTAAQKQALLSANVISNDGGSLAAQVRSGMIIHPPTGTAYSLQSVGGRMVVRGTVR